MDTTTPDSAETEFQGDAESLAPEVDALREELLLAILPNIVFDGWSTQALRDGALSAGLDDFAVARAFPGGIPEVVGYFSDWADHRMIKEMRRHDLAAMKVRQRIHLGVKARLTLLDPYREAVRRAIALGALPQYCALAPLALYRTVDAVWKAAGDTSTDHNFYTKRALLAGVLSATTLYWLEDASDDSERTWEFLDRRIADVLNVGKAMGTVNNVVRFLDKLPSPTRFMRRMREAVGIPAATSVPPAAAGPVHPSA